MSLVKEVVTVQKRFIGDLATPTGRKVLYYLYGGFL